MTPVVQKKKNADFEDLFADEGEILSEVPEELKAPVPVASTSDAMPASARRQAKFDELLAFMKPRLGKTSKKLPLIRTSAWSDLFSLATTKEQMEAVVELMPQWQAAGRVFRDSNSELFIRRCEQLDCPQLALTVFGNYAKYNMPLTLTGANQLLHSLHLDHPIETLVTAAALYPVYGLPPAGTVLTSASLLAAAYVRVHEQKDAARKAQLEARNTLLELRTGLEALIAKHGSLKKIRKRMDSRNRESAWTLWSLDKVDKALVSTTGEGLSKRPKVSLEATMVSNHISF